MKEKFFLVFLVLFLSSAAFAQFRDDRLFKPGVKDEIVSDIPTNLILGFFNPNNFSMQHSYSLSYSTFGNQGMALGVYTNSMMYKIADNLDVQADVSFVHSPYNSFGDKFAKDITGVYLSRAQINYKPWDNASIVIQYRNIPASQYGYNGYSPYGYYGSGFYDPYSTFYR